MHVNDRYKMYFQKAFEITWKGPSLLVAEVLMI